MKSLRRNKELNPFKVLGVIIIAVGIVFSVKFGLAKGNTRVLQDNIFDKKIVATEEIKNINITQNVPIPKELQEKLAKEKKKEKEEKAKKKTEEKVLKVAKVTKTTTSRSSTKRKTITKNKTTEKPKQDGKYITFNVSFYCSCSKCCGGYSNGITASGKYAKANHTIAAPKGYSFGTKIYLEGMGTYTVEDRGGAIYGNRIDVYVNSHAQALKLGRKQIKGYVVK